MPSVRRASTEVDQPVSSGGALSATGRPVILIAGPTAVGKSAVALALAERIGGEIVSVDSMQVYRGLDIGTAKPTIDERRRIPHHLIDVAELTEPFDAAQFVLLARQAVAGIQNRGRVPILCGGTGLYFKALLDGLGEAPPSDPELRAELEAVPLTDLLHELERVDPATFVKIDRSNPRRVVRAIEVVRLTGRSFSELRSPRTADRGPRSTEPFFGLTCTPDDLHARMDERVGRMFTLGLVAETEHLLRHGLSGNKTAMQAIGYRQVVMHLRGELSLADTILLVKRRTRQFAKRQMTWFRRQFDLEWIDVTGHTGVTAILETLLERCKKLGL